jgi:hypothetical protein
MAIVGSGGYVYEPVENWAKLPPGWSFKEIGGVGVDKHDNVYVFNRGEHPMIVLDRKGDFLRSFGEGLFPRAHGVFMAPDDTIWLTDDGDHTVRQCTQEGKVLLTLGTQYRCAQQPAAIEQRPRSSARPVLPTGADRSSVRANRSELHPSRGPASPPTVIAKKNSTKRIQQRRLRRPVRQVPPQSAGGTLRARAKIPESEG